MSLTFQRQVVSTDPFDASRVLTNLNKHYSPNNNHLPSSRQATLPNSIGRVTVSLTFQCQGVSTSRRNVGKCSRPAAPSNGWVTQHTFPLSCQLVSTNQRDTCEMHLYPTVLLNGKANRPTGCTTRLHFSVFCIGNGAWVHGLGCKARQQSVEIQYKRVMLCTEHTIHHVLYLAAELDIVTYSSYSLPY